MILKYEHVSIDGIQDNDLKSSLEYLFVACGLERSVISEFEDDPDNETEKDHSYIHVIGYGLPDGSVVDIKGAKLNLAMVMSACREGPPKRSRIVGPIRRPLSQKDEEHANAIYGTDKQVDEDDDVYEGPMLPGEKRNNKSAITAVDVKAQAEYRALELKSVASGLPMSNIVGGREEWMVNPGQNDFFSGVKSGQPIKSRCFQKKKSKSSEIVDAHKHPTIQVEMDAITQAHRDARGPSLMDEHRLKKGLEESFANNYDKEVWKWNRSNDLDAGRRVDKKALGMILGGAAEDLKNKFRGGFNR